jgi:CheY-like chemotaxis protein
MERPVSSAPALLESDAASPHSCSSRSIGPGSVGAVLLVEDDALVARAITLFCGPLADVLVVGDELEALRVIRGKQKLRAALIDVQLGRDLRAGLRVIDVLCETRPGTRCALMTASPAGDIARRAAARSARVLVKPFDRRALDAIRALAAADARESSFF